MRRTYTEEVNKKLITSLECRSVYIRSINMNHTWTHITYIYPYRYWVTVLACTILQGVKGSIVHQFAMFHLLIIIFYYFQPKQTHISWNFNEYISRESKNNCGYGASVTVTSLTPCVIDHCSPVTITFKVDLQKFGFLWLLRHNSFTISAMHK